jgi:exodeoxyribonuclease VII large subunit
MTDTYTILQLTTYIRDLIASDPALDDVWVEGEISNFTRARSGHLYFTLKDDQSELRCVMWKSAARWLGFEPQHGDAVTAHGRVTVYEARGQYQLMCDALQPTGLGDLNQQFEQLKAKLDAEGLFDPALKRAIPSYPRTIGVITSPTAAAFQDIQNVLRRRYPIAQVVLSPTLVQGNDAPPQIVAALERLNAYTNVDVILLSRGGGSLENLWCFNDERVVRAVAASRIPTVAGVGHEIDFTLVDFAADVRAPTPSAAAELVTPDGQLLRAELAGRVNRMRGALDAQIRDGRQSVDGATRLLARLSPEHAIDSARQRVDVLLNRGARQLRYTLDRRRDRVAAQVRALDAADPRALLRRGYAIVTRTLDGQRVTSAQDAAEGTSVQIALHDGELSARVDDRTLHDTSPGGSEAD